MCFFCLGGQWWETLGFEGWNAQTIPYSVDTGAWLSTSPIHCSGHGWAGLLYCAGRGAETPFEAAGRMEPIRHRAKIRPLVRTEEFLQSWNSLSSWVGIHLVFQCFPANSKNGCFSMVQCSKSCVPFRLQSLLGWRTFTERPQHRQTVGRPAR